MERIRKGKTKDTMTEREQQPLLILASTSKNRIAFMDRLGIPYVAVPSDVDERSILEKDPKVKAIMIAQMKARAVGERYSGIVIAADTFTTYAGKHFEKPADLNEARRMLEELSDQTIVCVTGISVLDSRSDTERVGFTETEVHCRELSPDEIEQYINNKPVTDWAAAYNPLDPVSAGIFEPINPYGLGLVYGIYGDFLIKTLSQAGVGINADEVGERFS